MKRLSWGLAIAATLTAASSAPASQAADCTNYWTNPQTGQQECLGKELQIIQPPTAPTAPAVRPSSAPAATSSDVQVQPGAFDFSDLADMEAAMGELLQGLEVRTLEGSATGLVDHLKGCQPYRYSFALEFMPDLAISQNVVGDLNGNCAVNVSINMPDMGSEQTVARCQFTPASIATLTDNLAYAEAQALDNNDWDAIGQISPERGSEIFERECQEVS